MKRRIFAWIILAAFLLLVINIIFIGYYRIQSALIYAVVAVSFIFLNKRK
jgi:hypothetical protein